MYSVREVETVLGLTPGRLRGHLRAGLVSPARDDAGQLQFSFQDLVLLRKAEGLVMQRIAPGRVHGAFKKLRESLPGDAPLSWVNMSVEGRHVVVHDGDVRWHPESGQVVFDFSAPRGEAGDAPLADVADLRQARAGARNGMTGGSSGPARSSSAGTRAAASPPSEPTAYELYEHGCALESRSPEQAMAAYRAALQVDPRYADVHVNLGRLLHEAGELDTALAHYRAALAQRPDDSTAIFNMGVALEDLGYLADAIVAYERVLAHDPKNADAHYNMARLCEQGGKADEAVRHLLAYRQLTRNPGR